MSENLHIVTSDFIYYTIKKLVSVHFVDKYVDWSYFLNFDYRFDWSIF